MECRLLVGDHEQVKGDEEDRGPHEQEPRLEQESGTDHDRQVGEVHRIAHDSVRAAANDEAGRIDRRQRAASLVGEADEDAVQQQPAAGASTGTPTKRAAPMSMWPPGKLSSHAGTTTSASAGRARAMTARTYSTLTVNSSAQAVTDPETAPVSSTEPTRPNDAAPRPSVAPYRHDGARVRVGVLRVASVASTGWGRLRLWSGSPAITARRHLMMSTPTSALARYQPVLSDVERRTIRTRPFDTKHTRVGRLPGSSTGTTASGATAAAR